MCLFARKQYQLINGRDHFSYDEYKLLRNDYTLFYKRGDIHEMVDVSFKSLREAWKFAVVEEYIKYDLDRLIKVRSPYPKKYVRLNHEMDGHERDHIIFNRPRKMRRYKVYMITTTPDESMYVIKGNRQKIREMICLKK